VLGRPARISSGCCCRYCHRYRTSSSSRRSTSIRMSTTKTMRALAWRIGLKASCAISCSFLLMGYRGGTVLLAASSTMSPIRA